MQTFDGIQTFFKSLGEESCYVMCLINIAELNGNTKNVIENVLELIQNAAIFFNKKNYEDKKNFLVESGKTCLEILTKKEWEYEYKSGYVKAGLGEFVIYEYSYKTEFEYNREKTHFVTDLFDPLQDSFIKRFGKVKSSRIFRLREGKK